MAFPPTNTFNTTPYNNLELSLNVGTATTTQYYLYFLNQANTVLTTINLDDYITGTYSQNTWHHLTIPLSALGLTAYNNALTFNLEASASSTIYLDNIKFTGTTGTPNYANPHAPTSINGVSYLYDTNGNLITQGNTTHSYTYNNYLNTSHNTATTTYTYDHQGQRVQKTTNTTNTIYPNNLYETQGTTTTKHIYAGGNLVATIKSDTPAPKLYHNHLDHLGSTQAVTTPDGYLDQEIQYYPFGETKLDNQYGSLTQSNQYIGQNFDQETELSYLNARYYDGTRGQMLTQDPVFLGAGVDNKFTMILKDPQLQNSYGYARNNPLIYKDPNGDLAMPIIGAGLGFIGGIATQSFSDYQSGSVSGVGDYVSAAISGTVVGAGTTYAGTVAVAYKLSKLATMGAVASAAGGLTASTQVGGDYLMGRETNTEDVIFNSAIAFGTAGVLSRLSKTPGRKASSIESILFGRHTQRQGAEEAVMTSTQSLGSSARAYSSGGSSRSSSNRISSNQYKSISIQFLKAQSALNKKDYNGATRALNNASNSLNKKKK